MASLSLCSCSKGLVRRAESLKKNQYYEEALEYYLKAMKAQSERVDLKIAVDRLLKEAAQYYFLTGREELSRGRTKQAEMSFRRVLEFDPGHGEAKMALAGMSQPPTDVQGLERIKREMELNVGLPEIFRDEQKMDFVFRGKTDLKKIFEALSRFGKVNILFDASFRERKVEISLLGVTFYQALEKMCQVFRCRYFVLDGQNIVIAEASVEGIKPYEKLVVKNLFFSNADVEEARRVIESVIKPERLVVNRQANSLIVADTAENLAWIEKVAEFVDKRRGELEIEVEIIEVDRNKLEEYGTELSQYQIGASLDGDEQGKRLNDFFYLAADDFLFSLPRVFWKFYSSLTDSQVLARPKVRGLDEERIEIKLGEKVPMPRTTFVPIAGGGVNEQPITSYDMQDVGIGIAIVPRIHHNREVTLELKFELTYVTTLGAAYVPPTLGNRVVSTRLRLSDNETGIIAGLIRNSSREGSRGIPLVNRIPILKEILSSRSRLNERTDIVISITPRIIRMPEIGRDDLEAWLIGTRDQVRIEKWKSYRGEKAK